MDFQVGDKVVCLLNGGGIVKNIALSNTHCVFVEFYNGESDSYTSAGNLYKEHENPCLFHEGVVITIKPAEPKRYPWVNIYVNNFGVNVGVEWGTKSQAIQNIHEENNGKYVDTIQLKPKEE